MFNMESMHLLNLSVQNALEHIAENFNLKNFLGGACARNSLEMCAVRSPDGRYRARILPVYTTSLLFTLFCQSGTYPFLDIGIVRCDWLRSKPKQSKFDQELLEMSHGSETNFWIQNASKTQPLNPLSADLSLSCRDAGHLSVVSHVPLMFLYK